MLEPKFVLQNLPHVKQSLEGRGNPLNLDVFENAENRRKAVLAEIEELRNRRNVVSERIASMKQKGENADDLILLMRDVSFTIKGLEQTLSEKDEEVHTFLLEIPNIPHESVPIGKNADDNIVLKQEGSARDFDFKPLPHWDIGNNLHILDFERAAKITGARFPLYLGAGARLERALINFMLDTHTLENGYVETLPPFIVNRQSMTNTGQLPKFEEDLFKIQGWDYFLIPTAEVPVTNIHADEILDMDSLPIYYAAYTPCFRSEAGSYGRDTRGLIRQHQFNKVELVKLVSPETSYDELEKLLKNAESILQKLELPYQVLTLCTGDLGFSSAKTYDIEVWLPFEGIYREISSCSNFESFQARRAGIRFKTKGRKGTQYVHTLNGSGLAVGRTVAAILENYQQADGSVIIPEALKPYMGGMSKIAL
ncbi:MAG: serine--tRNA ligase [Proteobacteria bacterium]|nr:serine--tRNA ligase [Pseudomonadota bacterium]MBU4469626.1 serine--tRNA ligase [Pseudomonadota bacterium]MCG2753304.1 serine--tRNA ligase [Desulfobacteraceae bacterium]